jgi:hypothetical protein
LFIGGIVALGEVHADDGTCEKAAAYQVSGEPGIHECLSHRTISADCNAVIEASMNKRIHECQEARRMLGPGPRVMAQDNRQTTLGIFTGTCRVKIIEGFNPCDPKVVNTLLPNGRSSVAFTVGNKMFFVNGGPDRQPNLNNYFLSIDTLRIMKGSKQIAADTNMEGECHFTLNDDGSVFYSIKCDVYDRRKCVRFNLYLTDITKADHETF